jgi:DNA-binding HxlR family transcriptional regulator
MELLDERWTLLVIRELLAGSRHFSELRHAPPRWLELSTFAAVPRPA